MGGIYARDAGEPEPIWRAIYHHYLPAAVETEAAPHAAALGSAAVTWASVALADKLDTLVGLFMAGERPTGSRDPFGLRRQAHGILRILLDVQALTGVAARPSLGALLEHAQAEYAGIVSPSTESTAALDAFLRERLEFVLQQRGARVQNVRAVVRARRLDDLRPADLERNLRELAAFSETESFRTLAEAFKRVRNIARELETAAGSDLDLRATLTEPAEVALLDEIEKRRPVIDEAAAHGTHYKAAYAEAAGFQPAIARFFTEVFVMAEDARLREARLQLMKRLETLILQLGDISEIVAES
jgi:glycyl-tRNA synthetase beta chain